jgi:hypothetical protein
MSGKRSAIKPIHRIITFVVGLIFIGGIIFGGFYTVTHFKEIAVSLNLPFIPKNWYPDLKPTTVDNSSDTSSNSSSISNLSPEWFDEYLGIFTFVDFEPFANNSEIDNIKLIYFGILSAVNDSELSANFKYTNSGETLIPAKDVEAMTAKFFDVVNIKHTTVDPFQYSASKKEYTVPAMGLDNIYTTIISNIKKVANDRVEVTIDYYNINANNENKQPTPKDLAKSMIATLTGTDGSYKILSLKKK